jgi:hypothetical protein
MRIHTLVLAAGLLAAPTHALFAQSGAQPQQRAGQQARPGRGALGARSPIAMVLARGADLKLSADQTAKLRAIDAELTRQNDPLRQQLQQLRPAGAAGAAAAQRAQLTREQREQLQSVMKQMRKNDKSAMDRAQAVLTREQKAQVKQLAAQRGGAGRQGARRAPGAQGQRS